MELSNLTLEELVAYMNMENQQANLTSPVQQLAMGGCQGHQVFQDQQYDHYSNTYHEGWWDHTNYGYSENYQEVDPYANYTHPSSFNQSWSQEPDLFQPPHMTQNSGTSLEDLVYSLVTDTLQFQQETRASIQSLEKQMSQLASSMVVWVAQRSEELSAQTMINPKENATIVTLRNEEQDEDETKLEMDSILEDNEATNPNKSISAPEVTFEIPIFTNVSSPPFPSRFAKFKEDEHEQDTLETLNNLFVEVIQQVSKYAPFLDDICTTKDDGIILVMENASTVVQRKLPLKRINLGNFMYEPDKPKKPRKGVG
jgi:hypothetical protein